VPCRARYQALTDPVPGDGWYDNQNGEIGDICAWRANKVGSYTVQKELLEPCRQLHLIPFGGE
jgi:hypothetical protein